MICKMTALSEYFDLLQHFHARNFVYEIYLTGKIKASYGSANKFHNYKSCWLDLYALAVAKTPVFNFVII